jgi:Na+-translocating ferredoxin:NAD+ oxidoreductase subunit G
VIEVLVGVSKEGRIITSPKEKIVGVSILNHSETPGLGARITEDAFLRSFADDSFVGRNLSKGLESCGPQGDCRKWAVRKDDPSGFVDVISGATISTRAVTEAVQRALALFNSKKEEMFRDE